MATARKSKSKNKPANEIGPVSGRYSNFDAWRDLILEVFGKDADKLDEHEISEAATVVFGFCECLKAEFKSVSRICDKNEDHMISVSGSFELDRRNQQRETKVNFRYAEKHGLSVKRRVPDPNQKELPLEATAKADEQLETASMTDGEPATE